MKKINFLIGILSVVALIISLSSCKKVEASPEIYPIESKLDGISWYKIDDLEKMNLGNKKVLIDVYTDWCGWCKVMDQKTFTDPEVISFLNQNFVMIKFNAEQKTPVTFQGKTYEFQGVGRGASNGLAVDLLNGRMGYPTIVYLDSDLSKIKVAPGYKTPEQLLAELKLLLQV